MNNRNQEEVYLYTRCSDPKQIENSHDRQLMTLRRHPRVLRAKVMGHFSDQGTGRHFKKRDGLDKLFKTLKRRFRKGDFGNKKVYVYIDEWSRFGRALAADVVIDDFAEIGVEVNCPPEWIDLGSPDSALLLGVKFGFARSESDRIALRTKTGIESWNLKGYHVASPPFGYKKVSSGLFKRDKRPVLICVKNEWAERMQLALIAAMNHKQSLKDIYNRYIKDTGYKYNTFCEAIKNPFYAGMVKNNNNLYQGIHEPLISWEDHEKIIDSREAYKHSNHVCKKTVYETENKYYLKGLLYDVTGKLMTAYNPKNGSGQRVNFYYTPIKGKYNYNVIQCHQAVTKIVRSMEMTDAFFNTLSKKLIKKFSEQKIQLNQTILDIENKIKSTATMLNRLEVDYNDNGMPWNFYKEKSQETKTRQQNLQNQLVLLKSKEANQENDLLEFAKIFKNIGKLFTSSSEEWKHEILKVIFPKGLIIDRNYRVRTEKINSFILLMSSKSSIFEEMIIKKEDYLCDNPLSGGKVRYDRTVKPTESIQKDKELLSSFVAYAMN